jgi:hypothetical protein
MDEAGSSTSEPPAAPSARIWATSSRMFLAPAPDAAWYVAHDTHSTHPCRKRPMVAISIKLMVQLPPM